MTVPNDHDGWETQGEAYGRATSGEGYGVPEEAVSVGAEMRADPYRGEESEEEEGGE